MNIEKKRKKESHIAEIFCSLMQKHWQSCHISREGEDPPDFWIMANGHEVFLELAEYRENCPHIGHEEDDLHLRLRISDHWSERSELQYLTPILKYKERRNGFLVPRHQETHVIHAFIQDLHKLILATGSTDTFTTVRLRPGRTLSKFRKICAHDVFAAEEDYPVLAKYCSTITVHFHPDVRSFLPSSSLCTRFTGISFDNITRAIRKKLALATRYREIAQGRPIWLLYYSTPFPSSARFALVDRVAEVIGHIRKLLPLSGGFDRVWWGTNLGSVGHTIYPVIIRDSEEGEGTDGIV
ncbi:MAG: hypothetical protein BWX88_04044 [Planctomycetes bacterium ADurb.Bin126]|nr:MAG: hypothetical protein BWX88_04044 [Planctomycetes bacterium ADurb.Bin126]HOD82194.1 hypothetical protein [Phycisphaerae bacterium]HQL76074.1 hypothetical protein [Phycisphaerae bacterium]